MTQAGHRATGGSMSNDTTDAAGFIAAAREQIALQEYIDTRGRTMMLCPVCNYWQPRHADDCVAATAEALCSALESALARGALLREVLSDTFAELWKMPPDAAVEDRALAALKDTTASQWLAARLAEARTDERERIAAFIDRTGPGEGKKGLGDVVRSGHASKEPTP